jgi:phosphoglycerol transferase MdoB-like AlkP superfamily enzyme
LLIKGNKRIRKLTPLSASTDMSMHWIIGMWQFVRLVLITGLMVIGIRGGLQYIPVGIRNAVQVTESKYAPIVLNTPFSIINTFANDKLPDVHYLPDADLVKYFNPVKQYTGRPFRKKNVVLIILESFSKEFTGIGGRKSYTPFLDSLMSVSYTCKQAYANGLHSAEGIPAVVSGVPSLMDEPITTSVYGANRITALPNVLKREGYQSAFYHGGTNGTMSFDVYCAAAGFDKYYGRTEYNNEKDYDGNWGIWDEPFLQYFAGGISKMKEPFMAAVFTLSSHPPYKVPQQYAGVLPKGALPIHQCVAYSDQSLRKFFATAAMQPWYSNTLFVITPDHCSPMSGEKYYQSNMGQYAIPVIFFAPGDTALHGYNDTLAQQIDILPSVLDYLGYDKKFFAYGNSIFRHDAKRFVINSISDTYQLLMNNYLLRTTDVTPAGLFAFPQDSACQNNLVKKQPAVTQQQLKYLKAFIQSYRNALNRNQLWIDSK